MIVVRKAGGEMAVAAGEAVELTVVGGTSCTF